MGTHVMTECIFTGLPVEHHQSNIEAIEYHVVVNNMRYFIRLHHDAHKWDEREDFFKTNKKIFHGLLLNNDWFEDETTRITIEKLKNLLLQKNIPKAPEDKVDRLFFNLLYRPEEDGQWVIFTKEDIATLWIALYFKSFEEMVFYLTVLTEMELIEANIDKTNQGSLLSRYRITFEGIKYAKKLLDEGDKSNKCFIAMAFREETKPIRQAIKQAVEDTGFLPIIIDEVVLESDRTINDEIIASIKKCRFCIADFSFHSNGVYFESGYALGLGKKVIYVCSNKHFKKSHFDIKPLQHIIYTSPEQLRTDLVNKIEAWVK